jgi:hypothetical protein
VFTARVVVITHVLTASASGTIVGTAMLAIFAARRRTISQLRL